MMALPRNAALAAGAGILAVTGAIFAGTLRIKPGTRKRPKKQSKPRKR